MSKKLIAGAGIVASFAVALAPLATFAATNHADVLKVTVPEVCTLGTVTSGAATDASDSTTHTSTGGTWLETGDEDNVAASGTNGRTDVLTHDLAPGMSATLGTTVFTVKCNDTQGYQFSAVSATNDGATPTSVATLVNGDFTILSQTGISDLTVDGNSYWNFSVATSTEYNAQSAPKAQEIASGFSSDHVIPTSNTTIVTGHGAQSIQNGETITVTYKAGIDTFQEAGTYEGKVTYTLTKID
ncbi:hypothetical protein IKF81_03625 [Candidatus Saccharibacteria bacterium]|nr:hypothetical protein [Candidatus Saccharibacteria bacterium]